MADADCWAEALLSILDVDISKVNRDAVPPTDDDAVLASWHAQMQTLERSAARMDAECGSYDAGGSYTPGGHDSGSSSEGEH